MSEEKKGVTLPEAMSEDDILRFTQRMRKGFVDHLTADGFPSDPKDQNTLLSAMADMDRSALQNKRIGSEANQAEADRLAAMAIAKMTSHFGAINPFEKQVGGVREIPAFDETDLPTVELVPGETDVGISDMTYEDMARKMAKE